MSLHSNDGGEAHMECKIGQGRTSQGRWHLLPGRVRDVCAPLRAASDTPCTSTASFIRQSDTRK